MNRYILAAIVSIIILSGVAFGSCSSPANQIEAENCKPGSTGWGINGSGDLTIQGFATDISYNVGQTVNFKINTTATSYQLQIFRMGYYQGNGARLITAIAPSAQLPQSQPACLTNSTTKLVDCGNWAISASWTIPTSAVSGIYFVDLVRSDTGGASQVFFIVRNDASHSDVLVQTSDETWQAYNPYGGHMFYGTTSPNLNDRAYKVSYNRPFNTANYETATWIYSGEYPMVRWLEANGYDVSYFTSVDAARSGSVIANHKIYLSVGHDEYWSGQKRASVEAARAAGVNLAFFSGNEVYWKTRWENSIDGSNTPYRTLVCYKETLGPNSTPSATAAVDPLDPPTWTGTWRDPTNSPPSDGGRPENALTGTLFKVNGPGADNTNLSIKVPAADGAMRFWRNTAAATQSAGQTLTLPPGTLGYEWDVEQDNGFRPAGLFDLSTATYSLTNDYLLDNGGIYGAGTATHHLTLYRYYKNLGQTNQTPLGLVFGAGTVQWAWGLDSTHDNSIGTAADSNMQQATVNLFADMGAEPATLQGGLLLATQSIDTIAPDSLVTSPTNGSAVGVSTTTNVTGTATDTGGGVVGGVEVSVDGGTSWHPATGRGSWTYAWTPTTTGFYTIQTRATDDSGNLEIPSPGITVAVDTTAQTMASLTLNSTSVSVGNSAQGTVTLGQPAASGGVVVTLSSSNQGVASVPSSVTVPAGQFSANFLVTALTATVPTPVTISGTFVATKSASLLVKQALPPPPGNLAIDALVTKDQGTSATTVNSGAFSTFASSELILAFVSTAASSANIAVTSMTGAGLTWDLVQRTNTQLGTSEVWRAFAANPVNNAFVTATLSQNVTSSMLVVSFAGVDTSGTNGSGAVGATAGSSGTSGAPTASLTSTRDNSMVLGVGNDWDSAIARIVGPNQTLLHQYLTSTGDTFWMQMQSAPIPLSGTSVTINDTSPTTDRYNLSIVEVRPSVAGTLSISGAITPPTAGGGTTLTLTGPASSTTTADGSGNYSFTGLVNGSYTVTPSNTGVVFVPTSQLVTLNGSSMTANFTAATLQSISVTPSSPTVQAGATQQFTAMGTYADGTTQNITTQVSWSSSNTNVATISTLGLASSIAGGTSTIMATLGNSSGTTILTVQATNLVITTSSVPNGFQNQAYAATLSASGGTAPYNWSLAVGTLSPGLSLSSGGKISGIPTLAGTSVFTVQVTDTGSPQQKGTQQLSITVTALPNTIWAPTLLPSTVDGGPDAAVELGVRFKSDVSGTITGVRFYKSSNNTGTHVGNLWSS
ncbi:MAG: hypothetical protein JWN74_3275, partial [Acidobacteriaceae bacterium]|nr:hypothetical protein [Acidobacteriaceae bacterium]